MNTYHFAEPDQPEFFASQASPALLDHVASWCGVRLVPLMEQLDKHCVLTGDEDGGVGIECRLCDAGGQPVAYYGWDNPYHKVPEVTHVREIGALINAATAHLTATHPAAM